MVLLIDKTLLTLFSYDLVTSYNWLLVRGGLLLVQSVNFYNFIRVLGDEIRVLIDDIKRLLPISGLSDSVAITLEARSLL